MSTIRRIRKQLGLSQAALAEGIGCTQGNVSFYEKGQAMPPGVAGRLIEFAKGKGHTLTYDDIYAGPTDDEPDSSDATPTPDQEQTHAPV